MDKMDNFKRIAEDEMKDITVNSELKTKTMDGIRHRRKFTLKKSLIPVGVFTIAALIVGLGVSTLTKPAPNSNIILENSNGENINQSKQTNSGVGDPSTPVSKGESPVEQKPANNDNNDSGDRISPGNQGSGVPINQSTGSDSACKISPWNSGTIDEAKEFMAEKFLTPTYIPKGYRITEVRIPRSEEFKGQGIRLEYTDGKNYFMISERTDFISDGEENAIAIDINGYTGYIRVTKPEPGDTISKGYVSISWKVADIQYLVQGDISKDEAMKVAKSLK